MKKPKSSSTHDDKAGDPIKGGAPPPLPADADSGAFDDLAVLEFLVGLEEARESLGLGAEEPFPDLPPQLAARLARIPLEHAHSEAEREPAPVAEAGYAKRAGPRARPDRKRGSPSGHGEEAAWPPLQLLTLAVLSGLLVTLNPWQLPDEVRPAPGSEAPSAALPQVSCPAQVRSGSSPPAAQPAAAATVRGSVPLAASAPGMEFEAQPLDPCWLNPQLSPSRISPPTWEIPPGGLRLSLLAAPRAEETDLPPIRVEVEHRGNLTDFRPVLPNGSPPRLLYAEGGSRASIEVDQRTLDAWAIRPGDEIKILFIQGDMRHDVRLMAPSSRPD